MKNIALFLVVVFTTFFLYSCEVETENSSGGSSSSESVSEEETSDVLVFVDSKEQKGDIKIDSETKISIDDIKSDSNIIVDNNGTLECASNSVEFEKEEEKSSSSSKTFDVTLDLTKIGSGEEFDDMTSLRIEKLRSLLDGDLYDDINMNPGDTMILRFIGTQDYGVTGKNIPLNDKITIKLANEESKKVKISNIECIKNERKKTIYLKMKSSNMKIVEGGEAEEKKVVLKNEVNSLQKLEVQNIDELIDIATKAFENRSKDEKYTKGSYIIEFLDQSDVLSLNTKKVKTFIFSDANFQLHPNFKKNYANPYNVKLDEIGDFTPETYNKLPQAFSSFYRHLVNDPYTASIKQKCIKNKDLYFIGAKNGTNKYFENIMQVFYNGILPNCKITFN